MTENAARAERIARIDNMIGRYYGRGEPEQQQPAFQPAAMADRSKNPLRPSTFAEIVGQEAAKRLMQAAVATSKRTFTAMEHALMTGPAGTGKSTFAHVIGNELGVLVYQISAPVSFDTLLQLRAVMRDRDILFVDEIHQQAIMERRGKESITQPEVFFSIMEDQVIVTPTGPLFYPKITVIGATTDPGRLPEAFLDRFTLRPQMVDYTDADLAVIAIRNARALGLIPTDQGAIAAALAAGERPRQVNSLVKQARMFGTMLDRATVAKVLEATGISADGLTVDQQRMLRFLYRYGQQKRAKETVYMASIGSIATVLGLSRDVKAIQLYVEPLLIKRGYVQVRPQGRVLTDRGIERARRL